jgi:hypothetical protein
VSHETLREHERIDGARLRKGLRQLRRALFTLLMPTLEPCEAGLTIIGSRCAESALEIGGARQHRVVRRANPAPTTTRLVLSLSMVSAEASTPLPV